MKPLHLGVVHWQQSSDIISLITSTFRDCGCVTSSFKLEERLPGNLDVVLACGPFGSLVPVANGLIHRPASQRPLFVFWMTEQFPNPAIPHWFQYPAGLLRSGLERMVYHQEAEGEWKLDLRFKNLTAKASRFRYYGDLYWLARRGVLSVLAVGSQWIANYLRERGLPATVAYIGSTDEWGADLGLTRDIPVLWIGKMGTDRRKHLLDQLRADLRRRGVEVMVIDGVEHPYVFGHERTVLLNRTKIVLNLLREPWDNHSLRYFLAAQNKALVVTEPTYPHTPFQPGEHLVQSSLEKMAETIYSYLNREDERQRIAENAYQLATTELTMRKSVEKILDRIEAIRSQGTGRKDDSLKQSFARTHGDQS